MRKYFSVIVFITMAILLVCAPATAKNHDHKPMVSLKSIEKKAGCIMSTVKEDYMFDDTYTWKNFTCDAKGGVEIYGENYLKPKHQALEITSWELLTFQYVAKDWYMARCRGYNVFLNVGIGKVWVSKYVRNHKKDGCKIQLMDGMTYSREKAA